MENRLQVPGMETRRPVRILKKSLILIDGTLDISYYDVSGER